MPQSKSIDTFSRKERGNPMRIKKVKHHNGRFGWKAAIGGVLIMGMVPFGFAGLARAQDAKTQALLDKVIAVHGGMEAWDNLTDMTFTITRVVLGPQGEVTGAHVSLYYMKPYGKIRAETITGKGLL